MITITNGQATQDLKLGQLPLLDFQKSENSENFSILTFNPLINKDLVSVGCPILIQASNQAFCSLLGYFSISIYEKHTTNIKESELKCL